MRSVNICYHFTHSALSQIYRLQLSFTQNLRRKSNDNADFQAEIYKPPLCSEKFFDNVDNLRKISKILETNARLVISRETDVD